MSEFNPDKLSVEFRKGVTPTDTIIPRKYTLTHSDLTGELFLTIGSRYATDKITAMRDEVLAEWKCINGQYALFVYNYVGGEKGKASAAIRNYFFVKELPLALQAIMYGDQKLFKTYPILEYAPIYAHFISKYPEYNRVEYWGRTGDYFLES